MNQLTWTVLAIDAYDEVIDFYDEFSESYADAIVDQVDTVTEVLREHPQFGRVVPEFGIATIREVLIKKYRLVYRYSAGEFQGRVEVIAFVVSGRLLC